MYNNLENISEITDEQEDLYALNQQQNLILNPDIYIDISNNASNEDNLTNSTKVKKMKYVSAIQYYRYLLCDRPKSYLHRFGRLFHKFISDQFSKIELG